jgi:hypothetical protein
MMQRRTGTLRPHEHVRAGIGWSIIPDLNPDYPFQEPAFAQTSDLRRAGVTPVSGARLTYRLRQGSARAIDIAKETT